MRQLFQLFCSTTFLRAFSAATCAGVVSAALRYMDQDLGYEFLEDYLPDPVVFNVFIVFVGLVGAFRTSHALERYTEAASLLHTLAACWYDVASTLIAFCRTSQAPQEDVEAFQDTLVRLISLLSALCFESLESKGDREDGHRFEAMGWADLGDEFQMNLTQVHCKVEHVFQALHQLVVDSMKNEVLNIAPPILTRSFQELGSGLLIYHEAKKLACVPLPFAYRFVTTIIVVSQACYTAFMLAMFTKGSMSAFFYTFVGTFLLWLLNGVADNLDNPFKKESSSLNPPAVQSELNLQLYELGLQARQASPRCDTMRQSVKQKPMLHRMNSMETVRKHMTDRFEQPAHVGPVSSLDSQGELPCSRTISTISNSFSGIGRIGSQSFMRSRQRGNSPRGFAASVLDQEPPIGYPAASRPSDAGDVDFDDHSDAEPSTVQGFRSRVSEAPNHEDSPPRYSRTGAPRPLAAMCSYEFDHVRPPIRASSRASSRSVAQATPAADVDDDAPHTECQDEQCHDGTPSTEGPWISV